MRVVTARRYGGPEVLRLEDAPAPVAGEGQVLVHVRASSVNPVDWHELRGTPYLVRIGRGLARPTTPEMGTDVAGIVEAVGPGVTRWSVGDEVFGMGVGAWAEQMVVREDGLARRPDSVSAADAGAVAVAGLTALQGLRTVGGLRPGQRVLVNGASGGVGHLAVQIAKLLGGTVTAVTSTPNIGLVTRLGADDVVDYTAEDFATQIPRYDLVLDLVGNRPLGELRRVLTSEGTIVLCGAPPGRWIGPLVPVIRGAIVTRVSQHTVRSFLAHRVEADLQQLGEWLGTTALRVVLESSAPLESIAEAVARSETGRVRGKVGVGLAAE